jgi:large subunit ribosomal protein L17
MRHLKSGRKLNRSRAHRDAMFNNMLESLFRYESVQTTAAKAKELRRVGEKLITRAKEDTLHNKRIVLRSIRDRDVVAKLFEDIAPKYRSVHGGYTRIIRLGKRQGDGAEMSLLELVEVQERKGTSRSKSSKSEAKKSAAPPSKPPKPEAKKSEEPPSKAPKPEAKKAEKTPKSGSQAAQKTEKTAKPKATEDTKAKKTAKPKASAAQKTEKIAKPRATGAKKTSAKTNQPSEASGAEGGKS